MLEFEEKIVKENGEFHWELVLKTKNQPVKIVGELKYPEPHLASSALAKFKKWNHGKTLNFGDHRGRP